MVAFLVMVVRIFDHPALVVGMFCLSFLLTLCGHNIPAVCFAVSVVMVGISQVINKTLFMVLVVTGKMESQPLMARREEVY